MRSITLALRWFVRLSICTLLTGTALAQKAAKPMPAADCENTVVATLTALQRHRLVQQGFKYAQSDTLQTLADQKAITEIPAPPFKEQRRAQYYLQRFKDIGFPEAYMDSIGNVIAERKGRGKGPKVVVAAHLDTVFPEGTPVKVEERNGRLYAPGIGDDGSGLAALLSLARTLQATGIATQGDIVFVGNVGEEGLGDLRGVKALFRQMKNIDGFISIDATHISHLVYNATGSRRYEITYKSPGGHSWLAFGTPSAVHALGRAIAAIAEVKTASELRSSAPQTTFTVGTVRGGTSVNTIASVASMAIDMRSNDAQALAELEGTILRLCRQAADQENTRWRSTKLSVVINLVGDRPAGQQQPSLPIIQAARCSARLLGLPEDADHASSTDANLPISLGIPAITIGGGGTGYDAHSIDESFDPQNAYVGVQRLLLTVLGLVGVEDTTPIAPLLQKRSP